MSPNTEMSLQSVSLEHKHFPFTSTLRIVVRMGSNARFSVCLGPRHEHEWRTEDRMLQDSEQETQQHSLWVSLYLCVCGSALSMGKSVPVCVWISPGDPAALSMVESVPVCVWISPDLRLP